jgi:anaerobic magnesium-protoporphyrin IX monomethyl ester cyclase
MSKVALLYPPITDPTSGYHSLSYIDSYARAQGHPAADLIDVNIEAFHHSYSPAGLAWLDQELAAPRDYLAHGGYRLDRDLVAAHLLRAGDPDPERVRNAVATLQDPERFYDYGQYQEAVDGLVAWQNCMALTGFPGQFREGFHLEPPPPLAVGSVKALRDPVLLDRLNRPYQSYYETVLLPRLARGGYDLIGINITYQWQLPFALWLAHLVRERLPEVFIVAGGTEVSDVWKVAAERRMVFEVFADLDAIVVGEGETAYVELLEAIDAGRLPVGHPNIRLHPRYGAVRPLPMLHYEKLATVPTPDFSRLPWDQYLSPERFVYYSPSRGCYWNKCTFCDYGLNTDGPTSPWRQDTVDTMIRDVTELSKFAKFIYFSVDVLAPATILRFAEQVVERGLDFRWGAEIRLEKYWSDERCALLKRSGCTAISVGFESANQRILDLIDKGTRPDRIKQTIAAMTNAGIGVQMMGFTGFPTETREEAMESIDFLLDNRDLWTFGGLGEFVLTPGAIVAKQPERFGISNLRRPPGGDVAPMLFYDEPVSAAAREEIGEAKKQLNRGHYDRPWLGAVDTPHTFFYHDRFGTAVREHLAADRELRPTDADTPFVLNGAFIPAPDPAVLSRYCDLYGVPRSALPAGRLTFRRADGRVFLLPANTRLYLNLFTTPTTLDEARGRAWILATTDTGRTWETLVQLRLIRRYQPASRAGTPVRDTAELAVRKP